jgi:hypothetical protein
VAAAEPIPRVERLAEAGPSRRNAALGALAMGVLLAAAEILLFDWEPGDMAPGAVLGTCLWGAMYYVRDDAKLVPLRRAPALAAQPLLEVVGHVAQRALQRLQA